MSTVQDFRANAFISTVLRPQLGILRDMQSEDGFLGSLSLRAVQDLVQRQSGDHPPDHVDVSSAVNLLLLLNEIELFSFGLNIGYFSADSAQGALGEFWREVKSYAASFDSYWDGFSDQFEELLKILNKDDPWDLVKDLEAAGRDSFFDRYARNRDLNSEEVKDFLEILLFSSSEEWDYRIDSLRILSRALVDDPALHLSDLEVDKLSWALSGADILFSGEDSFGFDTPFPNLVERIILNEGGYVFGRRTEMERARQQILESTARLTTNEIAAALRVLQTSLEWATGDRPQQTSNWEQKLREALAETPRREIG